ncbi:MAG: 2-oxo acid dehydrogenase subunit E2 [Planctomycetia bacterium]|nr:2-oxo acid dehydrogenase subunit E2 [Planctomycetia bacterium]
MADFIMPKLGSDMTAGTLVAWRKKVGDTLQRGDIIAEVETEKGTIEVECFTSGVLTKLIVQPGEKVEVGAILAIIDDGISSPNAATVPPVPASIKPPESKPSDFVRVQTPPDAGNRQRISPAARELAKKLQVDVSVLQGTGPQGAITREDVERAASASVPVAPKEDRQARLRETIAAAMSRSKREIPHYYLATTIDLQSVMTWLAEENAKRPPTERLLAIALLIKAVALALKVTPELNATWDGTRVQLKNEIHTGVAVALRKGGLIAPAVHHADQLTVTELMTRIRDLVNRARAGTLRSSELADPTITVTNLGEQGVESVYGVIYPPQVAIVGFGKIVERPWVVDGQLVVRPVVTATLAADHRVSDGHSGGRFLSAVDKLLQEPGKL